MPNSSGEPESTGAQAEASNRDDLDKPDSRRLSEEEKAASEDPSTAAEAPARSQDWWSATPPPAEWAQPTANDQTADVDVSKESGTADVYFCGQTTLFPLSRALQAIAKEKLTGSLRSFWDQEPIDLLAQNGEILFATTRDSERYCPDMPAALANVDSEIVAKARAEQSETGAPLFLTLAREEAIARQAAAELAQHYGQKLFSHLWPAPRVWLMFEKSVELPSGGSEVTPEPDVDDWALESLRFVQDLGDHPSFDARAIPAYTKDGFERVRKLQLTSDEAQFASQFNGARSVQQIAKNLRLDLKVARLRLFRFTALEIVECWPASTETKPEPKSVFQRFSRSIGLGR
ncbi:MAG: hypothetical protein DME68_04575 [Verrucomicrobia bacterium]|nr:MAG: hypothetical protein DME68_04575 [Verrucomicrobiota bacterium]